jgi:hypothetical protein
MITDLLNPSIEQLVAEIVAINHAWKEACELFDDRQNAPLAQSLRDLKTCKQIRLLRNYAPLGKRMFGNTEKRDYLYIDRFVDSPKCVI